MSPESHFEWRMQWLSMTSHLGLPLGAGIGELLLDILAGLTPVGAGSSGSLSLLLLGPPGVGEAHASLHMQESGDYGQVHMLNLTSCSCRHSKID